MTGSLLCLAPSRTKLGAPLAIALLAALAMGRPAVAGAPEAAKPATSADSQVAGTNPPGPSSETQP